MTPADCDVMYVCVNTYTNIHIYILPRATIKNAIQRNTFKNTIKTNQTNNKNILEVHKNRILKKVQAAHRKARKIKLKNKK